MRAFAALRTLDQWARASHLGTAIDAETGGVELVRIPVAAHAGTGAAVAQPAGLAFDGACRLYRSVPAEGRVERVAWEPNAPLGTAGAEREPVDLLAGPPAVDGDFAPTDAGGGPLRSPRGLAVDDSDRLFVAETGAGRVLVYDLWTRALLRRIGLGAALPLDLATRGETVLCVTADGALLRLSARGSTLRLPLRGPTGARPLRVAVCPGGRVAVLFDGGRVVPQDGQAEFPPVPGATDLEFADCHTVVVARQPGEDLLRFRLAGEAVVGDAPLKARGYDGSAIVRTPDGRIAYWTERGLREAPVARARYADGGRVITYRLDGGDHHLEWGRLFLDACVPQGCELRVQCATADEDSGEPPLPRVPPPNLNAPLPRPDLSPPLPPSSQAPSAAGLPLHRRETGRELAWARFGADDAFETYEAPVLAPPGRYLWVTLDLTGTGHATPRVRSVRAEHPSHDLVRRLPRTFSRDVGVASFLRRYLALVDGTLDDLLGRADARATLVDPHAAPEEALPWLASFLGMALDERWPLAARRQLIAEAPELWRARGTVAGLTRFLELYLGRAPLLIEHFRLRGLGGALLTDERSSLFAGAVVGSNLRVGGAVGRAGAEPLTGAATSAFETHAHRFSVLVPAVLDADGFGVVRDILEAQRPAHTVVDVCTVASGMRVGIGLHVELLSTIGRSGGWDMLRVGGSRLGRHAIVGRPQPGARLGVDGLGDGMRVG